MNFNFRQVLYFRNVFFLSLISFVFSFCQHNGDHGMPLHSGEPLVFNPDGGWCWFQDERGIIDNGRLLFASVSSVGDIILTVHDLQTNESDTLNLHPRFQQNDHAQPALMVRPDGRYLIVYSRHNGPYSHWRVSKNPGDPTRWGPLNQVSVGDRATYSNVYHLTENRRTYNFHRGIGWHPNVMVSDDEGDTWTYLGRLAAHETHRPYLRFTSNHTNRIHFIMTEAHPRDFENSQYHGYIENDRVFRSDGVDLGSLEGSDTDRSPFDFTKIFSGDEQNIAWASDIELDSDGFPHVAYSVTRDRVGRGEGGMDHRYRYARWDGSRWHDYEIAYAGTRLYPREDEYTGLISLHPDNPTMTYISTDADPVNGEPLISEANGQRHYEIFQGHTRDGGATWSWKPVTENSTTDNIRPIVVAGSEAWAVLWLRGEYTTYTDYNLEVVGHVVSNTSGG